MFQGESDEKEDKEEKRTQVERWNAPPFSSDRKGDWERETVRQKQTSPGLEAEPVANYSEN